MISRIFLVFFIALFLWPPITWSADSVEVYILEDFNTQDFRNITPVSNIKGSGIVKLWGYIKIMSDTAEVEPETYYLEWVVNDGNQEIFLESYRDNENIFVYERKIDRTDDYYWVTKRIWPDNEGDYKFRVYVRREGQMRIIGESKVFVEEENR